MRVWQPTSHHRRVCVRMSATTTAHARARQQRETVQLQRALVRRRDRRDRQLIHKAAARMERRAYRAQRGRRCRPLVGRAVMGGVGVVCRRMRGDDSGQRVEVLECLAQRACTQAQVQGNGRRNMRMLLVAKRGIYS